MKTVTPPDLASGTVDSKREQILDYFTDTYLLYESLFSVMASDEAYYLRADPLRHPLIFYLGHTAVFFINKLYLAKLIQQRVNSEFESVFSVGVDEMSWDDIDSAHYNWPSVEQVWQYRQQVYRVVEALIRELPLELPITWKSPFWAILMGIEHEYIHLETSSVLIRQLPLEQLKQNYRWSVCRLSGSAPKNRLLAVTGQQLTLGKPVHHPLYGWDNEYGEYHETVADFSASQYLVSNQEFLDFVNDSGYQTQRWWTQEGQQWLAYTQARYPRFWLKQGEIFKLRTLTEVINMPWNWPVEVNYLEAKAFCNWLAKRTQKPIRLPTEAQWYVLRNKIDGDISDWSQRRPPANISLSHFTSVCPIDQFSVDGFYDIMGNVWQWTETTFNAYSGFKVHPLYDDFSTPTFDGQHNLIKGGSWISCGNEASYHARYAFRRHFYQYAGFRYVESQQPVVNNTHFYEQSKTETEYLEFHYGDQYYGIANFPQRCARIASDYAKQYGCTGTAMDLGCAVGRASFELATVFSKVIGVDFSARFINAAVKLKDTGYVRYCLQDEGEIISYCERDLASLSLDGVVNKVEFIQSDAGNLKPQLNHFDLVLAINLIDRLPYPGLFLQKIADRINPQGLLVIASPYTWLQEYTDKAQWLGGFRQDGENITTLDGLHAELDPHFTLLDQPQDVPFFIRETARKGQHSLSQLTVWQKR